MVNMSHIERWIQKSIPILLGLGLIVLILLRVEVAAGRFFDVDEFTHMHWAAQIFMGEKPYVDFFTFFPPGYHWLLQPLFVLFKDSATIFIAGRFLSVAAFMGILVVTAIFFARFRSVHYALLPVFILAFLPMPYDKYFEIRPDTWSTFLGFVGVMLLSFGWGELRKVHHSELRIKNSKINKSTLLFFSAGVVFAICLLVLPKMLPFVMVASAVEAGRTLFELFKKFKGSHAGQSYLQILEPFLALSVGGILIAGLFFIWLLTLGNFGTVWYSLTKEGIEGNQIGKYFIMEPHLFFFPNSSFYGGEGITLSYVVNHTIWFIAIIVGSIRLFTPFITIQNDKTTLLDELVMTGIFFVSVYGYIYYFPLKHTQYLIPIAVFIAFYAADGLVSIFHFFTKERTKKSMALHLVPVGSVILLIIVGIAVNRQLNARKLVWKNNAQMEEYDLLIKSVPKTAVVVDLEGKMLTWKNGYYVCCLAFGQFGQFLSHPLPKLSESLVKNNVEYIYQGDSGRLPTVLPEDMAYINQHYAPLPEWNGKLLKRK